jgi:hypothetical protein
MNGAGVGLVEEVLHALVAVGPPPLTLVAIEQEEVQPQAG